MFLHFLSASQTHPFSLFLSVFLWIHNGEALKLLIGVYIEGFFFIKNNAGYPFLFKIHVFFFIIVILGIESIETPFCFPRLLKLYLLLSQGKFPL